MDLLVTLLAALGVGAGMIFLIMWRHFDARFDKPSRRESIESLQISLSTITARLDDDIRPLKCRVYDKHKWEVSPAENCGRLLFHDGNGSVTNIIAAHLYCRTCGMAVSLPLPKSAPASAHVFVTKMKAALKGNK